MTTATPRTIPPRVRLAPAPCPGGDELLLLALRDPADRTKAADEAGLPHPDDLVDQAVTVATQYEAAEARRDAALAHLEAAHEAVRLAGGRVRVGALERPDFDEVRRNAEAEIRAEFATLAVAPDERLRLAAEAVDQAEEEKAALLPERDEALNSLAFYTTARGVYLSAGITRQGLLRVQQRALGLPRDANMPPRAAGVRFVKCDVHTRRSGRLADPQLEYDAASRTGNISGKPQVRAVNPAGPRSGPRAPGTWGGAPHINPHYRDVHVHRQHRDVVDRREQ
ncbi:hypothetical protein ABZV61_41815 [Streptomyces sp900116325]|uniref:Uncharacterized protein n=1 Tax=Streptomyces sp. 900116325 TaxID=3154295 RepID=A0ABV2UML4_9ACTN